MASLLAVGVVLLLLVGGIAAFAVGVGHAFSLKQLWGDQSGPLTDGGFVELEGTARSLHDTVEPVRSDADAVMYEYTKERRKNRSDEGATWQEVEGAGKRVPFVVEGDSQSVVVNPEGATNLLEKHEDRAGQYRHTSQRLEVGESAYVAGTVARADETRIDTNGRPHVIHAPERSVLESRLGGWVGDPFVVSDGSERSALWRLFKRTVFYAGGGAVCVGASVYVFVTSVL